MEPNEKSIQQLVEENNKLKSACRCALADLEGIMPEYEPSGDRTHPAWRTIEGLREALNDEVN